jgi:hypothetical protein
MCKRRNIHVPGKFVMNPIQGKKMEASVGLMPYCNPTGLWTGIMWQDTPKYCRGFKNEVYISKGDREILRRLAEKVRSIALGRIQDEKRQLWYDHNSLKTKQPVVLCDPENGWNEIITGNQVECSGDLARRWEVALRKEIFWGESIQDDRPIEPYFYIGYTYEESGWGVDLQYIGGHKGGAYTWNTPIEKIEDIQKLRFPEIEVDYKTTLETIALAGEVFGGLLEIRLRGIWWWSFGMTADLIRLVGLTQMMMYMYDNPTLLHRVMDFLKKGNLQQLDFLEEEGLLSLNNDDSYIGSGGIGYCSELPQRDVDTSHIQTNDLWGFSESQETVGVSPAMYEEFVFQYQLPILQRFGLNCFGCCEPVDTRWHILKNIPNLRRLSVSAWADRKKMSEYLEDKYIFSWKPNPAFLAVPHLDEEGARKYVRETLEIAKGSILEIIMKDNHTIGHNPENVKNWVKIVRDEIDRQHS